MQFKAIAISAFLVGFAAATSPTDVSSLVNQLPPCSLVCLMSGATAAGCEATDYKCQCKEEDKITTGATSCLTSACTASDIGTTKRVSNQICEALTGTKETDTNTKTSEQSVSNSTSSSTAASSSAAATEATVSPTPTPSNTSAGSRAEFYGLGLAAVAGLAGLAALV